VSSCGAGVCSSTALRSSLRLCSSPIPSRLLSRRILRSLPLRTRLGRGSAHGISGFLLSALALCCRRLGSHLILAHFVSSGSLRGIAVRSRLGSSRFGSCRCFSLRERLRVS